MPAIHINSYDFKYLKDSTLGGRLRFFRQQMMQYHGTESYTVTSLGERLGITPQSISAIERGASKNPSFLVIHKLTKEYRVPLESVTDDFYQAEENLFTIGVPQVIEVDIDLDDDFGDQDVDFFNANTTIGILLYRCFNQELIEPLFHQQLPDEVTDDDLVNLTSRLSLESTLFSKGISSKPSELSPLEKASQLIINNHFQAINSTELIDLITTKSMEEM